MAETTRVTRTVAPFLVTDELIRYDLAQDKRPVGEHLLTVPNTAAGRKWMRQFNKYINREWFAWRARGRGTRPTRRYQAWIPQKMAQRLAVYVFRTAQMKHANVTCPACNGEHTQELNEGTWMVIKRCAKCMDTPGQVYQYTRTQDSCPRRV